jgi:AmpE protein
LFKVGEHWQLEHRLEPLFRHRRRFSLLNTLLMTLLAMAVVWICILGLKGILFGIPQLLFWMAIGLLCIGAGKVRLHYHAYLKAATQGDHHARDTMAEELTLIHGVPPECSEGDFLRELQNALLWINYRFYLAPLFWFVIGGAWGPVLLMGYAFLRAWQGAPGGCRLCAVRARRKSATRLVCFTWRSAPFAISGADQPGAVFTGARSAP